MTKKTQAALNAIREELLLSGDVLSKADWRRDSAETIVACLLEIVRLLRAATEKPRSRNSRRSASPKRVRARAGGR